MTLEARTCGSEAKSDEAEAASVAVERAVRPDRVDVPVSTSCPPHPVMPAITQNDINTRKVHCQHRMEDKS
jgi:hypothetical protein